MINGVHLVRGSGFSDNRDEEVIIGEAFAKAHGLQPGDRLEMILNRRKESFVIVGTAISPEYIYMVQSYGSFAPDPEHFGILYVKENYAREILGFKDAANQVAGQLAPGYEQDVDVLLEQMDRELAPYGVLSSISRRLQPSNRFLSDEIRSLGITAMIMPTIFLFVAVLVLNVLMSRFAQSQRTIIGTFKAIGYSNWRIVEHYLSFGLIIGFAGGGCGHRDGPVDRAGADAALQRLLPVPELRLPRLPGPAPGGHGHQLGLRGGGHSQRRLAGPAAAPG